MQRRWRSGRLIADLVTSQAQCHREGDAVGVGVGGLRGANPQRAERLIDHQKGEDLLPNQLRAP
jgi:hypothetical protein